VVKLFFDTAHRGGKAALAVAAENTPSLSQPAPAKSSNGDPDLFRGEAFRSPGLGVLGGGRLPVVDDRFLVLGGRLVIVQAAVVILAELLIRAQLVIRAGIPIRRWFLIMSQ